MTIALREPYPSGLHACCCPAGLPVVIVPVCTLGDVLFVDNTIDKETRDVILTIHHPVLHMNRDGVRMVRNIEGAIIRCTGTGGKKNHGRDHQPYF